MTVNKTRRTILASMAGFLSTGAACLTPADRIQVTNSEIEAIERECANANNSVEIQSDDSSTVILDGHIGTDRLCDELSTAVYTSANSNQAIIEVLTNTPHDVNCRDCTATLKYQARIAFQPHPSTVRVKHVVNGNVIGTIDTYSIDN